MVHPLVTSPTSPSLVRRVTTKPTADKRRDQSVPCMCRPSETKIQARRSLHREERKAAVAKAGARHKTLATTAKNADRKSSVYQPT